MGTQFVHCAQAGGTIEQIGGQEHRDKAPTVAGLWRRSPPRSPGSRVVPFRAELTEALLAPQRALDLHPGYLRHDQDAAARAELGTTTIKETVRPSTGTLLGRMR